MENNKGPKGNTFTAYLVVQLLSTKKNYTRHGILVYEYLDKYSIGCWAPGSLGGDLRALRVREGLLGRGDLAREHTLRPLRDLITGQRK